MFSDTVYAEAENSEQGLEKLIGFEGYMMEEGQLCQAGKMLIKPSDGLISENLIRIRLADIDF
ncbi:MAG: hypothetical protein AB9879_03700 [Methanothrix sp.]